MAGWDGKGSTRYWREVVRPVVLERDGFRCQINGPGCTGRATHVDHKLGKGVSEDLTDMQAACEHCNTSKGRPTGDPEPITATKW
ncbi:HNH endonuclease [Kribbella sp. DT2]|uniref:HNH endonuclease n=1 Tax=Kribbella sp. DT2 TaxID=3393427 RepID=UPI003CF2B123